MGPRLKGGDPIGRLLRAGVRLFENLRVPYLVVGGLAASLLGEPRFTADVDVDAELKPSDTERLLKAAGTRGFRFRKTQVLADLAQRGAFRLAFGDHHLDVLRASTDLEREAFKRSRRKTVYGIRARFPSPEDLILMKLVAGREQDVLDARAVFLRNRRKLDRGYLTRWAAILSDRGEDLRLYNTLHSWLSGA